MHPALWMEPKSLSRAMAANGAHVNDVHGNDAQRCDSELLGGLPPFDALSAHTRLRLVTESTARHFVAGATLFNAGEPATALYIILEGQVRVLQARHGRQRVVHTEGVGGTLAEVPLFAGGVLPATAEAITATRCLTISGDALRSVIREDPSVALLFLRTLSLRVRSLVERLDRLSSQSVTSRLAAFMLSRIECGHGSEDFSLGMTQEELAEELATVREVIVRGLAQLRRAGAIESAGRGRFRVRDAATLRRLAAE